MILLLGTNQPWSAASNLQDSRWEGDAPSSLLREAEQQGFSRQPEEPPRMGHQHWQKQVGLQCSCPWLPWQILDREADRLDFFCSEDQILGYNHYRCSEIPKSRERSRLVGWLVVFLGTAESELPVSFLQFGKLSRHQKRKFLCCSVQQGLVTWFAP